MRSMRSLIAGGAALAVAAGAVVLVGPGAAVAHHPEVDVACVSAAGMIRIDAVAWDAPDDVERLNERVEVRFDGVLVGSGSFTRANNFRFSLTYDATGATPGPHVVRATSVLGWGPDGNDPDPIGIGAFREDTIVLPCATWPTTTSTAPPTTTTTAPPTTSTAPATTTTVDAVVGGVVELRPDVAQPLPVAPRFAG